MPSSILDWRVLHSESMSDTTSSCDGVPTPHVLIDPEERGLLDTYSLDEEIGVVKTAVTVDVVVDDDVTITSAKI